MDAALEAALQQATGAFALSGEQKAERFTALRRAAAVSPQQLELWEDKAELLRFLAALYAEKRLYQRQVVSFLELLLSQPGWPQAAEPLRPEWPEAMAKVVATTVKASEVAGEAAEAAEATGGYAAADAPMKPRRRSMADTFAMFEDSLKRLSEANYSYSVTTGSGLEEDDHFAAFEVFRRAVCRVTQDQRIETSVLDDISPKDSILHFLLEVLDRKPRHKKRVEALLVLLLQLDSWRIVAESSTLAEATAKYRKSLTDPEEAAECAEAELPAPEADELAELLADAQRRGALGVLLIRVIAAYNLVNADWFSLSDPYTKVTVDKVSKTTAVVDDCLDPRWDEERWSFDVQAESSIVRLAVWDKDAVQDDPLGSISIPLAMVPTDMKRLRFQLDRVEHGELEVEMQFLRVETNESISVKEEGEELLVKSGGRKLPGPKGS